MKRLYRRFKYMLKAGHIVDIRGFTLGFKWTENGEGFTARTTAAIAGYHPRNSLTWRWALYWQRPRGLRRPRFIRYDCGPKRDHGYWRLDLPLVGGLSFRWRSTMNYPALVDELRTKDRRIAGFAKGPWI